MKTTTIYWLEIKIMYKFGMNCWKKLSIVNACPNYISIGIIICGLIDHDNKQKNCTVICNGEMSLAKYYWDPQIFGLTYWENVKHFIMCISSIFKSLNSMVKMVKCSIQDDQNHFYGFCLIHVSFKLSGGFWWF